MSNYLENHWDLIDFLHVFLTVSKDENAISFAQAEKLYYETALISVSTTTEHSQGEDSLVTSIKFITYYNLLKCILDKQACSWVSFKGVRRHKMFRVKSRASKARDAGGGVWGYAPLENFENLGGL